MSKAIALPLGPFDARRRIAALLMSTLAIVAYALVSGITIGRLVSAFTLSNLTNLVFMLACLVLNAAALVWQRQGRFNLSALVFMAANSVVLAVYAILSPGGNALLGLVVALALAAYAGATLPRRSVPLGTFYGFATGAFLAVLDYVQPWARGRLNLNLASPVQLVLVGLGVVFMLLLARLYRGMPLNAKLLLAGGGTALLGVVIILGPLYGIIVQLPPPLSDLGARAEETLVVAAAVFVVAAAMLSQALARAVLGPLHIVAAASAKVAEGDLNALHQPMPQGSSFDAQLRALERNSQDETGDLVSAFNAMTGRLQQLTAGLEENVAELGEAKLLIEAQYQQLQAQTEELQAQYEQLAAQNEELIAQESELHAAQTELQRMNSGLEQCVADRTADLNQANAELARALRAKDEFLAAMSHDLRSPLNSILLSAGALEEGVYGAVTPPQLASVNGIIEGAQHLLEMINDILDLARIGAGKVELAPAPMPVLEVCQSALRLVNVAAHHKRLVVHSDLDPQVTALVADGRRVKQILVNLLTNAVKFTPAGGQVGLTVRGEPEAGRARFTVWDTGVGIAAADMDKLFKPFVQLSNGLRVDDSGTGLGLSLVRGLAELHGGSVAAESVADQGSRFTVWLPWCPAEPALAVAPVSALPHRPAVGTGHDQCILLAEDGVLLTSLTTLLQSRGYRVVAARDGLEALEVAAAQPVDLVLMDIQMPRLGGLDAIRQLRTRAATAGVPIIALTALAMPGDRERCLQAGADDYLSKPVNLHTLLAKISEHLAEKSEASRN